jgi:hypothetical protein
LLFGFRCHFGLVLERRLHLVLMCGSHLDVMDDFGKSPAEEAGCNFVAALKLLVWTHVAIVACELP